MSILSGATGGHVDADLPTFYEIKADLPTFGKKAGDFYARKI